MKFPFLSNQPKGGLDFIYQPTKSFAMAEGIPVGPMAKEIQVDKERTQFRTYYGGQVIARMDEVIPLTAKVERSFLLCLFFNAGLSKSKHR